MTTSPVSNPILSPRPRCTWIDAHAHLADSAFIADVDAVLARAEAAGVTRVINVCTDIASWERGEQISSRHPGVSQVAATPPHTVANAAEEFPLFSAAAYAGKLVAIGETGLDYHYYSENRDMQKTWCRRYMELATACQLPLVVHCREAFADLIHLIDTLPYRGKGMLHCFTGTGEEGKALVERGWYLSFSGIVTFKKSEALRQVAADLPLEHILIETDAPYLAPQSRRGKRCEPADLPETAACLAATRGLDLEVFQKQIYANTLSFFGLSP